MNKIKRCIALGALLFIFFGGFAGQAQAKGCWPPGTWCDMDCAKCCYDTVDIPPFPTQCAGK